ncbi:protein SMAX1-like [Zea mays]|uniref:Protein SUPPRESSOR OF MAX2 1 n=2 Tax=Zea mays TaxID=4577 RepID=A0A1D6HMU9_MAIZE|nr:protein SMAX1-like [Zea mays]AQK75639.1 Protein SUPPRESSOR OF MAX2 1 [Zea mays]|eukprot:XP_008646379.1 protein SMAX1-like [Zea mays]
MRAYAATPAAVATLPSAAPPLTPDAAAVLSRAAADASRRRHAHTTPLHAAAALLSGPAPLLRDACVAGLASPHPLRCRALDLCFSVALDRLPTSTELQHHEGGAFHHASAAPPLSNALAAALKRAYAHHRRIGSGGVETDDHRVGVPHLVLAILDDPSVARVMREASFSSTAVKAAMLRSLSDPAAPDAAAYVSARVMHRQASHREEEVAKVVEVLKRAKKRNPVLVGDTVDVDAVVQEVVTLIQRQRLGNARVISFPKEFGDLVDMDRARLTAKVKELGEAVRSASASAGVVVNLGNLQWLVEERCAAPRGEQQQEKRRDVVLDTARAAVAEMARVLNLSGEGEHRVWVIGTATCATYLKCQVYHPALESEWDLQAVPITPRPPPPPPPPLGLSPSAGVNRGILSSSVEVLSTAMTSPMQRAPSLCSACAEGYERERAEMASSERAPCPAEQPMSQWLQIGTPSSGRPADRAQEKAREADELRRRWRDRCAQLHSHGRPPLVTCSEWNGASILASMQAAPPVVPVRPLVQRRVAVDTDLALGLAAARPACETDDKLLVRRLTEAVRWQPEAAAAVASTIAKARSSESRRRRTTAGVDAWIVFAGPDVAGKRSMAEALSKSVFGTGAVTLRLGWPQAGDDGGESVVSCRGQTALDRMAEAIRANPFRVVVLDGVDHADSVVHASILRAVESGRLSDSHGRDVALGNNIFVVISQWSPPLPEPEHLRKSQEAEPFLPDSQWNLEHGMTAGGKKRRPEQQLEGDRRTKARKHSAREPLPLDLNLSMSDDHTDAVDDSGGEGSRNSSSDLTVEHEQEYVQPAHSGRCSAAPLTVSELIKAVDGVVVFKPPVSLEPLKRSVSDLVVPAAKLGEITVGGWPVHVDDGLLGRLAARAAGAAAAGTPMEAWTTGEVLCPSSMRQFKRSLSSNDVDGATVEGSRRRKDGEMFPMPVTVDGN